MVKHIWTLIAKNSSVDIDTNNLSIYNIIEVLNINTDKIASPINLNIEYEIISMWTKDNNAEKDFEYQIVVTNPSGKSVKTYQQIVKMAKNIKRMRTRFRILGFAVEAKGVYKFVINLKDNRNNKFEKVTEIPLEVKVNDLKNCTNFEEKDRSYCRKL